MVWEDGIEGGKLGWMVRVGGFIIRMCPSIVFMVGWEVVVVGGSGIWVWLILVTVAVIPITVMLGRILIHVLLSWRLMVRLLLVALLKSRLEWVLTTMWVMWGWRILASVGLLRVVSVWIAMRFLRCRMVVAS
jgi:hypothetical protein